MHADRYRMPALLIALLLGAGALTAQPAGAQGQHAPPAGGPAVSVPLSDTARVRRWREDLSFITQRVRRLHPRPFGRTTEAEFDSAASSIERRIATTDDSRLATECMRLVALIHDGHTMVVGTFPPLGFTSVLPVFLRPFENGLYVTGASAEYADVVGAKVTRVGDVTADEALARVGSATSGDNRYTLLDRAPLFLMMPALLHALGISTERDAVTLEIQREEGKPVRLNIAGGAPLDGFPGAFMATEPSFPADWKSARQVGPGGPPRCDRLPEDAWWFEYLPSSRTLYLRMRRVDPLMGQQQNPENYLKFYQRFFARADSLKPAALVIDLRHNHGGNNTILDPLIRGIIERPWLNREGGLFALIDRGTFSAAMNAAVFLGDQTRATFVGEPTGGGLNHYGDATEATTPNFGMMIQVSTIPWLSRVPQDPRPWIAPDIAVPSSFGNWREGRDAELEEALDAVRHGTREQQMLAAARKRGTDAAVAAFHEWNRVHPTLWGSGTVRELSGSVSACMDRGAWSDAALLGDALVRLEPESALAFRVAGEAHMNAGNRARAVEYLRKVIQLNPRAVVARNLLRQMGETP